MQLLPIPKTREEFWQIIKSNKKGLQAEYMGSIISIIPIPNYKFYDLYINGVKSNLVSGSILFNWRLACHIVNNISVDEIDRNFSEFYYYPETVLNSINENQHSVVTEEKMRRVTSIRIEKNSIIK